MYLGFAAIEIDLNLPNTIYRLSLNKILYYTQTETQTKSNTYILTFLYKDLFFINTISKENLKIEVKTNKKTFYLKQKFQIQQRKKEEHWLSVQFPHSLFP